MPRSDFAWVNFDHTFTATEPQATKSFTVEGSPLAASGPGSPGHAQAVGYLLIQAFDVESPNHQVQINGKDLPSFDLPPENAAWQTWMDRIPPGFLQQGDNRLTIRRSGDNIFHVANVAVHWREAG